MKAGRAVPPRLPPHLPEIPYAGCCWNLPPSAALSERAPPAHRRDLPKVISVGVAPRTMIKLLELVGFAAIGGTIYAFLGMGDSEYRWPVFGACAGVAMAVIIYRKRLRDKATQV